VTRQHDPAVQLEKTSSKDGKILRNALVSNRPKIAFRQRISNRLAIIGMAVGYLGLVVVLASTPIWSQVLLPYQSTYLACMEAGGSR